ncbi:hypothetical protein HDV05_007961 [Chytridiales sp. JEL 0842]|nr:hypothetical protein HDV05_007961 [Chytridiales sp. JEL 0842]
MAQPQLSMDFPADYTTSNGSHHPSQSSQSSAGPIRTKKGRRQTNTEGKEPNARQRTQQEYDAARKANDKRGYAGNFRGHQKALVNPEAAAALAEGRNVVTNYPGCINALLDDLASVVQPDGPSDKCLVFKNEVIAAVKARLDNQPAYQVKWRVWMPRPLFNKYSKLQSICAKGAAIPHFLELLLALKRRAEPGKAGEGLDLSLLELKPKADIEFFRKESMLAMAAANAHTFDIEEYSNLTDQDFTPLLAPAANASTPSPSQTPAVTTNIAPFWAPDLGKEAASEVLQLLNTTNQDLLIGDTLQQTQIEFPNVFLSPPSNSTSSSSPSTVFSPEAFTTVGNLFGMDINVPQPSMFNTGASAGGANSNDEADLLASLLMQASNDINGFDNSQGVNTSIDWLGLNLQQLEQPQIHQQQLQQLPQPQLKPNDLNGLMNPFLNSGSTYPSPLIPMNNTIYSPLMSGSTSTNSPSPQLPITPDFTPPTANATTPSSTTAPLSASNMFNQDLTNPNWLGLDPNYTSPTINNNNNNLFNASFLQVSTPPGVIAYRDASSPPSVMGVDKMKLDSPKVGKYGFPAATVGSFIHWASHLGPADWKERCARPAPVVGRPALSSPGRPNLEVTETETNVRSLSDALGYDADPASLEQMDQAARTGSSSSDLDNIEIYDLMDTTEGAGMQLDQPDAQSYQPPASKSPSSLSPSIRRKTSASLRGSPSSLSNAIDRVRSVFSPTSPSGSSKSSPPPVPKPAPKSSNKFGMATISLSRRRSAATLSLAKPAVSGLAASPEGGLEDAQSVSEPTLSMAASFGGPAMAPAPVQMMQQPYLQSSMASSAPPPPPPPAPAAFAAMPPLQSILPQPRLAATPAPGGGGGGGAYGASMPFSAGASVVPLGSYSAPIPAAYSAPPPPLSDSSSTRPPPPPPPSRSAGGPPSLETPTPEKESASAARSPTSPRDSTKKLAKKKSGSLMSLFFGSRGESVSADFSSAVSAKTADDGSLGSSEEESGPKLKERKEKKSEKSDVGKGRSMLTGEESDDDSEESREETTTVCDDAVQAKESSATPSADLLVSGMEKMKLSGPLPPPQPPSPTFGIQLLLRLLAPFSAKGSLVQAWETLKSNRSAESTTLKEEKESWDREKLKLVLKVKVVVAALTRLVHSGKVGEGDLEGCVNVVLASFAGGQVSGVTMKVVGGLVAGGVLGKREEEGEGWEEWQEGEGESEEEEEEEEEEGEVKIVKQAS